MDAHSTPSSIWRSPLGIFMLIAGAIGVYYLLTEHLTHVAQAVPYLFLLACPLMHMFHGHGHGHHGHGEHDHGNAREQQPLSTALSVDDAARLGRPAEGR